MNRRAFIQNTSLVSTGLLLKPVLSLGAMAGFPEVRTPLDSGNFTSTAVESAIRTFGAGVKNKELA